MGTTILLVDDDVGARRTLASLLQRFGFRVVEAEDGPEALITARTLVPDLVLSDYNMPGMNGAALLRELRTTLPTLAAVPFVLFSGYIDHWTGTADDPAPDVVLSKPVTIERLLGEINALLKRRNASPRAIEPATRPAA
ncbi:MAG TPA: response regulator [Opitutaceae bacterium]|nr:response regulator [Opitutaceae bacterium]